MRRTACLTLALALLSAPAIAQDVAPANPLIDYPGFEELVRDIGPLREAHRLPWRDFERSARADGAVLLDTRSAEAFAQGHLRGAVNLPFSDFTDVKLQAVLGADPDRPIYIYCNNNFSDDRPPVVTKRAPLALNIPTFINLHGYGYRNVWELADVIATGDPDVDWVTGA
ncbi:MAG: rhodanese-like domain-containing protein [Novosphingobium sp.]